MEGGFIWKPHWEDFQGIAALLSDLSVSELPPPPPHNSSSTALFSRLQGDPVSNLFVI